ncbi:MAG: carbohydrate ABC transporter permease [Chloroflexi bacterium]|nr:carbohydrate ABC transporter permease [Chloroflexota bacterium]MCL5946602.1 carbohydrate ABC transporter permease [Chloroflexota bacterium]
MALIPAVSRRGRRGRMLITGVAAILWIGVLLHLFPVYWMLTSSVKGDIEIWQIPPQWWPNPAYLQVYQVLWNGLTSLLPYPLWVYVKNSIILVVGVIVLQIPCTILIAYAISRLHTQFWSRVLFAFVVGTMMIPGEVSLIPSYLLLRYFPFPSSHIPNIPGTQIPFPHVDFLDTYWAVILPSMAWGFAVLIMKGWFDSLSNEMLEAARMDGASELRILTSIAVPVSWPVIAFLGYSTFNSVWNSFLWPLIVLQKESLHPLAVAIYEAQSQLQPMPGSPQSSIAQGVLGWNGVMAMGVIESIPVFIAFVIFREQIVRGVKITGLG